MTMVRKYPTSHHDASAGCKMNVVLHNNTCCLEKNGCFAVLCCATRKQVCYLS